MAPVRPGRGHHHRDGLRADKSSAIAQRRGDPCPQSRLVSKAKSIVSQFTKCHWLSLKTSLFHFVNR